MFQQQVAYQSFDSVVDSEMFAKKKKRKKKRKKKCFKFKSSSTDHKLLSSRKKMNEVASMDTDHVKVDLSVGNGMNMPTSDR